MDNWVLIVIVGAAGGVLITRVSDWLAKTLFRYVALVEFFRGCLRAYSMAGEQGAGYTVKDSRHGVPELTILVARGRDAFHLAQFATRNAEDLKQ